MKLLDAGTDTMSNADVAAWIKGKREQHEQEDAEDKAAGKKPSARPANFMNALKKHERELNDPKYPIAKNPKAYASTENTIATLDKLDKLMAQRVVRPDMEVRAQEMKAQGKTAEEMDKELEKDEEKKMFTETEHLMVMNHAPQSAEMLQSMIENVEERFTAEEQEEVVQIIQETFRKEETEGVAVVDEEGAYVAEEDTGAGAEDVGALEQGFR